VTAVRAAPRGAARTELVASALGIYLWSVYSAAGNRFLPAPARVCLVMMTSVETVPANVEFTRRTEPYRHELLAHCYRMLGSPQDAEDVVQETYLRAWRAYDRFEERSSVRTWLYRIATNACLNALRRGDRRTLPSGLGPGDPRPDAEVPWLQPIPDALVTPPSQDPAAVVTAREGVRLALVASLQFLPPRQRAVLILREVLGWPAADVAELLDSSMAAVKSTLQRARARLAEVAPAADRVSEPSEPEQLAALERYMAAWETSDPAALEQLLRVDATLEVTPSRDWAAGKQSCMRIVRAFIGVPGDWRMLPTRANGQPAAAAYWRGADGVLRAYAIGLLQVAADGVAGVVVFGDAGLFPLFGLPSTMDG
jgi:RNA polymerase sigma-70 factor (ECF subfamily)